MRNTAINNANWLKNAMVQNLDDAVNYGKFLFELEVNESLQRAYCNDFYLPEEYHVSGTFDACVPDIQRQVEQSEAGMKFDTGWRYDRMTDSVVKGVSCAGIPIYVDIITDNSKVHAFINKRMANDSPIVVTVNKAQLDGGESLKHEFQHALTMYVDSEYDMLAGRKDAAGTKLDDVFNFGPMLDLIYRPEIDFLSKSEQEARLTAVEWHIKHLPFDEIKQCHRGSTTETVVNVLEKCDDYSLLKQMQKFERVFYTYSIADMGRVLALGYYLYSAGMLDATLKSVGWNKGAAVKKCLGAGRVKAALWTGEYGEEERRTADFILYYMSENRRRWQMRLYGKACQIMSDRETEESQS